MTSGGGKEYPCFFGNLEKKHFTEKNLFQN